jgi:HD-like signal output (HDOD) protein/CheY-like chemotaxis protein
MSDQLRALFVDDDSAALHSLKRVLRSGRGDIEAAFVDNGSDAVAMLAGSAYDVVVTDIGMPGMSGLDMLEIVADRHPDMARLILSERTGRSDTLRAAGLAHQYLAKPCDLEGIQRAIRRSVRMREELADPELRRLAGGARSLPSVPDLYHRINTELASEDPSVARVGEIIAQDPAMSVKILQIVNSAFFGLRRVVTDISQATSLLGLDTISSLVLGVGVFRTAPADPVSASMVGHVYESSLEIASAAKRIAQLAGVDRPVVEEAYLAGLIQDIGILALASNWPARWRQVDRSAMDLSEHSIFGTTHAAFGAYLASLWGLPDSLVEAIRFHNDPTGPPTESGFSPLVALHVARAIINGGFDPSTVAARTTYLETLGLTGELPRWIDAIHEMRAAA